LDAPKYEKPPDDPALAILEQQNQIAGINALQDQTRLDSARLMATYGTRLALAGSPIGTSPLTAGAPNPSFDGARKAA
jgi:hypothetical protein